MDCTSILGYLYGEMYFGWVGGNEYICALFKLVGWLKKYHEMFAATFPRGSSKPILPFRHITTVMDVLHYMYIGLYINVYEMFGTQTHTQTHRNRHIRRQMHIRRE